MAFGQWHISEKDEQVINALVDGLGISRLAAVTLAARGYKTTDAARDFLNTDVEIEDPFAIKDMDKAVTRIRAAIDNEEVIAVFGDYDVDGITATALLVQFLLGCGAHTVCSLPTRDSSGYGLSKEAIDNLKKHDVSLIITVDNGISSYDEVAYAAGLDIDVVVADHHLPPPKLPDAVAVVDPLRADDTSVYKDLAGVGVALKLAAAVEGCDVEELLDIYGYLVAIGTVSDIMPLTGENRAIVSMGLEQLRDCDNVGLAALGTACEMDMAMLDTNKVAFTIAPRLNAAGRMGSADMALQLLLSDDMDEAAELAEKLIDLNTRRREAEAEAARKIADIINADRELLKKPVIIIAAPGLHSGVTGIVCSRMVDRYGKPVIIISVENEEAKGSGRSVPGFSLHDAIESCSEMLAKYGGHEMAAGFTLNESDIDRFKEGIWAYCAAQESTIPRPGTHIDAELRFGDINEDEVAGLSMLEPFGCDNETPVFCAKNLTVNDIVPMGDGHSRVTLGQGKAQLTGAVFGKTPDKLPYKKGDTVDAAFALSIYATQYKEMVSVRFKDIRRAGLTEQDHASVTAYDRLCAGIALTQELSNSISLTRDDITVVYRLLQKQRLDRFDLDSLCFLVPGMAPGRILAVLDILEELGLVVPGDSAGQVTAAVNPKKKDLTDSELYRKLSKEEYT